MASWSTLWAIGRSHRVLNDLVELFQRQVINLEVSSPFFQAFISVSDPTFMAFEKCSWKKVHKYELKAHLWRVLILWIEVLWLFSESWTSFYRVCNSFLQIQYK